MISAGGLEWEDDEELDPPASTPTHDMDDDAVENTQFEYSDRPPGSWVVSGPLRDTPGPGRRFAFWRQAEVWAREKYGDKFIRRVVELEGTGRWGMLIRSL